MQLFEEGRLKDFYLAKEWVNNKIHIRTKENLLWEKIILTWQKRIRWGRK